MKLSSVNPTHKANLSKSGFDMSFNRKFTSSVGQLLPVLYDFLIAGDKVKISEDMFTRTNTLSTSAFVNIKEHIEYFFVPMHQIYSLYPQWRFSVGEPKSNLFDKQLAQYTYPSVPAGLFSYAFNTFEQYVGSQAGYPYYFYADFGLSAGFEKNYSFGVERLLNMFNLNVYKHDWDLSNFSAEAEKFPINLSFLCAYQKVFFDWYSVDDRMPYDNLAFNLDAWYQVFSDDPTDMDDASSKFHDFACALSRICQLRYVPWKKDYFTGMMVSPLETPSSLNTFFGANLTQITDFISKVNPEILNYSINNPTGEFGDNPPTQVATQSFQGAFSSNNLQARVSTGAIRKMFALEKLLSITRRAQDDYQSQVAAHFGTDISSVLSDRVIHLGGTSNQILINDVAATMNNENTDLGEIAGKGFGSKSAKGDTVRFTAPCDGILLGVYYARPEIDYKSGGVDKLHTFMYPSDLYTAEYSNLGEQPVNEFEFCFANADEYDPYGVLGWQFRYQQFKEKINLVNTGFILDGLSDWTIAKNFDYFKWSSNTQDFYVNPNSLDSIMLVNYKGSSDVSWNFGYDPLLHWFKFNYFKVSVMDKFGLPQL